MSNYIEEDIIAVVGLLAARHHWSGGDSRLIIERLSVDYQKTYDDIDLNKMFTEAYSTVLSVMPDLVRTLGDSSPSYQRLEATAHTLQTAIENFESDGRKKGFFQGAFFRRSKNPVRDAKKSTESKLSAYSSLLISGAISIKSIEKIQNLR